MGGGGAGVGHFQRHGGQQAARGQGVDQFVFKPLVVRRVVLLAHQQQFGGQQRGQRRLHTGVLARAGATGQKQQGNGGDSTAHDGILRDFP